LKSRRGLAQRLSNEDAPEASIAELERREWGAVVAAHMRAQLLEVAARDGAQAVADFVADLLDER
jgi:hypothetical protein